MSRKPSLSVDIVTSLAKIGRGDVRSGRGDLALSQIESKCFKIIDDPLYSSDSQIVAKAVKGMVSYIGQEFNKNDKYVAMSLCGLYSFVLSTFCLPGREEDFKIVHLSNTGREIDLADFYMATICIRNIHYFFNTRFGTKFEFMTQIRSYLVDQITIGIITDMILMRLKGIEPVYGYDIMCAKQNLWEFVDKRTDLTKYGLKDKRKVRR